MNSIQQITLPSWKGGEGVAKVGLEMSYPRVWGIYPKSDLALLVKGVDVPNIQTLFWPNKNTKKSLFYIAFFSPR